MCRVLPFSDAKPLGSLPQFPRLSDFSFLFYAFRPHDVSTSVAERRVPYLPVFSAFGRPLFTSVRLLRAPNKVFAGKLSLNLLICTLPVLAFQGAQCFSLSKVPTSIRFAPWTVGFFKTPSFPMASSPLNSHRPWKICWKSFQYSDCRPLLLRAKLLLLTFPYRGGLCIILSAI